MPSRNLSSHSPPSFCTSSLPLPPPNSNRSFSHLARLIGLGSKFNYGTGVDDEEEDDDGDANGIMKLEVEENVDEETLMWDAQVRQ